MAVLVRPRSAFAAIAARPRLAAGFIAVLLTGVVSLAIELAATLVAGAGGRGVGISLALPVLFLAYWLLSAWLVDAGASLVGRSGRRREFLAVSGSTFPPLVTYALLSLLESAATRWTGSDTLASGVAWVTLPVLAWFLTLNVLAIRAVYNITALSSLALAMLPYAALTAALTVVLLTLGILHAFGVV
jgi:hypothetical protein